MFALNMFLMNLLKGTEFSCMCIFEQNIGTLYAYETFILRKSWTKYTQIVIDFYAFEWIRKNKKHKNKSTRF